MSWFYPRLLKFKSDGSGGTRLWVPNFNGVNSYGTLLTTFTPTGAGTVLTVSGIYKSDGSIQQLLAPDASTFNITVSATNVISFDLLTNVTINGLPATSGVTVLADGYIVLTGDVDASADIKTIGANAAFANNFQSQIHQVTLTDPLDSNNSLDIDMAIRSADMPTETSVYNKLDTTVYPELVVNGGFDIDSWWVRYSAWIISNGVGTMAATSNFNPLLQDVGFVGNKCYIVSFDVVSISGYMKVAQSTSDGLSQINIGTFTGIGSKSFIFIASEVAGRTFISFARANTGVVASGSIDNISVKRINKVGNLVNLGTTQPYVLKETE